MSVKNNLNQNLKNITMTNRDIEKRNIAKQNKLNYLEIFSYKPKETIEILKSELHKYKYKE